MDSRVDELRRFVEERCMVKKEGIKLASGRVSNFYLDCRLALMDPKALPMIAELVLEKIRNLSSRPAALGGAIVGAVPITAAVIQLNSIRKGIPISGFMVRKEVKEHGLQKLIENPPPAGSSVAIVEDVVTTGGSTIRAIDAAEAAGLKITAVIPVVDRDEGGDAAIRKRVPRAVYAPLLRFQDFEQLKATQA
jgi:orotate phosphoribosyltransferase